MYQYNSLMEKYVTKFSVINGQQLPDALSKILEMGFVEEGGGFFFREFFTENVDIVLKKGAYFDLSGFEYTTNRFHIEDYCEQNRIFELAFAFINSFSDRWENKFPKVPCIACISFQVGSEFGDIATFTFYVEREGQVVIDINTLNEFVQPLLIKRILSKRIGD